MLPVLYQDEHIVAVHKPAGLLVHRSLIDKYETRFAMQMVRDQLDQHVFTVHRLDKPTSGVLLFALSRDVARRLNPMFAEGQVAKTYRAIVRGFSPVSGRIEHALKEKLDAIVDKKARTDKGPQPATSEYNTLARFELPFAVRPYKSARYSLVELYPHTGRKHQLRRHMAHINHPIVGDANHGDGKHNAMLRNQFDFQGLALTACQIAFNHPVSGQKLVIKSESEPRMQRLLTFWRENNWECKCPE
ncbi:pseudouridine synthase [Lacimicrobium alkaliphilum]|uniref:tRNA pseudouridine synthase C n=1 Tax=Lacimicrobium alkaliphilum TaxID=1526571 RepID=A0ABQ1RDJ7_9ALTE|nr:pseudouridine synthase [Lacimicrobium alkaliphilum]GGD66864.1 tRNA pseudouridine(65) synthase TruC [Lacimicrobium alkaliphilum]